MAVALLILLLAPTLAGAQTKVILEQRESMSPETITLPLEVPPFSIEHQVRLSLEARIDAPRLMGSNPWLIIQVNGNQLALDDLLNKTNQFVTRSGVDMNWFSSGRWRILYSPDFEAALTDKENAYSQDEKDHPYRFVWDITRHVKPGANELKLVHLKVLQDPDKMVLRNVTVEVGRFIHPPAVEKVAPAPTGLVPTIVAGRPARIALQAKAQDATLTVRVADQTLQVRTRISLPAGQWREAQTTGPANWTAGPCRVARQVTVKDDHVHIADTFTNNTDQLIGVMVEHHAEMPAAPEACYLAGRKSYSDTGAMYEPAHPSVFAQFPGLGVGLVAEDDVFRVHARSFHTPQSFGLADGWLGLAPRSSITLEWSLYPVAGGDYWSFVNAVRRNWGVNFTIPGAFVFSSGLPRDLTGEQYAKWMHDRGLKYICGGIAKFATGLYAHGTGILGAPEFIARERDWTTKMAAADPDLTPIAYFHAHACTEDDGRRKYADSRLLDAKGQQIDYPFAYPIPLYVPTEKNSYGQALWGFVNCLIDDIKVKGIYWDEMSYSVQHFAHGAAWDGCSVLINRTTHALEGKWSSVPLLIQPLSLKIVDYIQGKGLFFMGNSQAFTRTMMRKQLVRFVETNSYSALADTHLACPLGLGNHCTEETHTEAATHVRELLKRGALYYGHYYFREPAPWNYTAFMFPLTPEQIGPGYVLGKERIHTAVSGRFGFPDGAAATVYVVNGNGERVTSGMVTEVSEGGKRLYELRLPGDHFAILVRQGQ